MTRFLHRLGRVTAAHPRRTPAAWLLVAATATVAGGAFGGTPWRRPSGVGHARRMPVRTTGGSRLQRSMPQPASVPTRDCGSE